MNPMHQCIQKISPENSFSYVRDVRTDKGDAICGGIINTIFKRKNVNIS